MPVRRSAPRPNGSAHGGHRSQTRRENREMQRHPEPLRAWHSLSSSRTANCQILLRAICFIMPFSAAFRSTFATSSATGQPNSRSQRESSLLATVTLKLKRIWHRNAYSPLRGKLKIKSSSGVVLTSRHLALTIAFRKLGMH